MAISGPSTYPLDAGHSAPSLKIGEQHMPLFAVIRDKLRERILSGEFTPGDRLIEGRLSDDMGVSRIPVREALRALAAEGLVTIEPRRGASVAVPSEAIAYDMVEVRATLEGLNAKLAAQRRDDATVTRLRKFLDDGTEAARSDDLQQFLALNSQFHEMLATIAGNVVLTDLMRSLRDRTALLFAPSNMRRAKQNWDEHAQILNAVIAGNGELASLLATQHVHNAARAYTEAQQQNQPSAA
ncbi:GntR family transcriptional regulator [Bordetella pertussis]|uniref:GntR-family transcription regulator n=4 Tax=Bordetella pertussis TaxID=520 RepID=Q7VSP7_BORPE|nr:GntR family transcriptional regulator [Bordetella pertussis]ETH38442.1 FCD domain protein [Bordetella pertussis H918]ETH44579.1 FCD domain protein [Bordetella pertussis H939]ETH46640.1 FCD domain protein [Bordetella pertussis H921]ETH73232.1 FCD domain protein [Bordetella pertussis STO1-CHLA-0011]ETH84709.1 FCD domain protein [Bordetella pertussis STO1-CHOC-0017]ETH86399.1 FCD domain protein [Bordetella pertussis STO1-CHOC-0018]ETH91013.1 FCD domain protein [Bordetella pertussis STO1-CHOC